MTTKLKSLVLLLAPLLFISCKNEPKAIDTSGTIFRDGAEISYNIYGDGGATLLFVHGSYIDQTYWAEQVKHFSSEYKVVTMDLPGHGKSGKGRKFWSVENFAGDVYAIIKRLKLKNVILIGHSLAGDINLMEATSHPKNIIGFIGIDTFKNVATPVPAKYKKQVEAIRKKLKKDFANTSEQFARTQLVTSETSPEITERIAKAFRNAHEPMGQQTMPEIFNMYKTERRLLPKLRLKIHLINVDYSPTNETPLKKYASSGYDVRHMKGTCHYPMLENPQELNRLLRETIEEISRENDALR
jgi:sigma-B regulation protein RsbQ